MIRDDILSTSFKIGDCLEVTVQENDYYIFYDFNIIDSEPMGNRTYKISSDTLAKLIKTSEKNKSYYLSVEGLEAGMYKFNYISNKSKHHRIFSDSTSSKNNLEPKRSGEDLREYGYQILSVE